MKLKLNRLHNITPRTLMLTLLPTTPPLKPRDRPIDNLFLGRRHDASSIDSRLDMSNWIHRDIIEPLCRCDILVVLAVGEMLAAALGRAFVVAVAEDQSRGEDIDADMKMSYCYCLGGKGGLTTSSRGTDIPA